MSSAVTITMSSAHSPTFPSLHLRHSHSPTLPLLHLRHRSLSNPSFASPMSQALHLLHLASRTCIKLQGIILNDVDVSRLKKLNVCKLSNAVCIIFGVIFIVSDIAPLNDSA